ncbi:MAG: hypothetical protein F6J87_10310 [Spirulina sp. SIO3F2]|nr:hypothetical protein [Spirulina sp. SIO3F2]
MEPANILDPQTLKTLIKEGVREVMREEWLKFFEMLLPYVDDAEQADIESTFNPADYTEEDFEDVTNWFES